MAQRVIIVLSMDRSGLGFSTADCHRGFVMDAATACQPAAGCSAVHHLGVFSSFLWCASLSPSFPISLLCGSLFSGLLFLLRRFASLWLVSGLHCSSRSSTTRHDTSPIDPLYPTVGIPSLIVNTPSPPPAFHLVASIIAW